jgi:NitT/TauT family transport system permease protein
MTAADDMISAPVGKERQRFSLLRLAGEWIGLVGAVVLLGVWEVTAHIIDYPYLPPVSDILVALWGLLSSGVVFKALSTTLVALGIGLVCAILIGTTIGAAMGLSATARFALSPYVDALMSAPMTAFVPLFMLLFGLGIETRIIVVIMFAFFPIVVNTQAGMMAARADLIEMARSFNASSRQTFFKVRLPMSYPHIRAGLRMAMARGVDGIVTGEVLIAAVGIGGLVTQYGRSFTVDRLFAVVIVIVCLSFAAVWLVDRLGRALFGGQR